MIIFPAIDLKDGKCVRLRQGDFDKVTVYGDDPIKIAEGFIDAGATHIHIVDLDGARTGESKNLSVINKIASYPIIVQTGGGIRSMSDIEKRINAGVFRVIIGTAAVKKSEFVKEAVNSYKDHIAVGIDAKNGMVAISGWEEISEFKAVDFCLKMKDYGVSTIIYTDISKDGMLSGFNFEMTKKLIDKSGINIIASGGITTIKDLEIASEIGAYGAIVGQAIYKRTINLDEAITKFQGGL